MNALPLHVGAPDSTVIYADQRTTTQNGIAQAMFKESSRTFELKNACGTVLDSVEGAPVPSTSLTATSLNNLATLLLTQGDLMAAMPLFEYIHETAPAPSTPTPPPALCIPAGGRRQGERVAEKAAPGRRIA